ncbi:hypothetical protein BN13_980012 [Nostocoides jenkinsii Ben 74]|uniref:Uncharacterized protein n=1 Tax=Nostocoides jenkinsii Ben 74 TaxID=1193518 RepID=A0A077MFW1_9MICO|nr:hypothetical protein BN13_980012 [Tetrasphaera jenkinsii Ben 74]
MTWSDCGRSSNPAAPSRRSSRALPGTRRRRGPRSARRTSISPPQAPWRNSSTPAPPAPPDPHHPDRHRLIGTNLFLVGPIRADPIGGRAALPP